MPREANLFEQAGGSVVRGYILLKQGGGNIPPNWIDRASASRTSRHKAVAAAMKKGGPADIAVLEDWELAYRKEAFYYGIRALFELERKGKTKL
jgi:hypothetical protein